MKKFLLSLVTVLALAAPCGTQVSNQDKVFRAPAKEQRDKARADSIGAYWEDEDGRCPIYMGSRGGLFYYKNDKKKYIPKAQQAEIKEAMGIKPREE